MLMVYANVQRRSNSEREGERDIQRIERGLGGHGGRTKSMCAWIRGFFGQAFLYKDLFIGRPTLPLEDRIPPEGLMKRIIPIAAHLIY